MILDRIDLQEAFGWIDFTDRQKEYLSRAYEKARSSQEIISTLELDAERMEKMFSEAITPKETLIPLYGEDLCLMHSVLVMLSRLKKLICEYREHRIDDQILRDTLFDLRIWMDVCEKDEGRPGLKEVEWLVVTFMFRLFRLGRLQFIYRKNPVQAWVYRHRETKVVTALCPDGYRYHADGNGEGINNRASDDVWQATLTETDDAVTGFPIHPCGYAIRRSVSLAKADWELALKPDDPIFEIHIAEGCPLSPEAVSESLRVAPAFFKEHMGVSDAHAFACGSWLLDDNIALIQPNGNIAAFQKRFHRVPHTNETDWQTRQRAFGNPDIDILSAECKTSLQKAIHAWYLSGRECRHCEGFILMDK